MRAVQGPALTPAHRIAMPLRAAAAVALSIVAAALMAAAQAGVAPVVPGPFVDVIAVDARDRPFQTLRPADFSVTEDGTPREIVSVGLVRGEARLVALFLDEFHLAAGPSTDLLRAELERFVRDGLAPDDRVVVLKPLDSLLSIAVTADRAAALDAIASFTPRKGNLEARTEFERRFVAGSPARIVSARAQIATSALNALATQLGSLGPARKSLIVVSDGFAPQARARGEEPLPTFETVVRSANRARVAIYPIEIGPNEEDDGPAVRDALQRIADQTGGRRFPTGSDVAAALRRVLDEASGYYAVGLAAHGEERDGRFHPVQVRVSRPGISIRARPGYWVAPDLKSLESRRAAARDVPPPLPRRISPLIRPWFGMAHADAGATRVTFVWEPAARIPGDRRPIQAPARVSIAVTREDGTPVFAGLVLPAGAPASGMSRVDFETAPGRVRVEMSIQDASARVVDTDVREIVVGGFPGPVTLGTAEVLRARTARELRELAADSNATPVAARQFSRTEQLLVRVSVFSRSNDAAVAARLVSSFGSAMRELQAVPGVREGTYEIAVPLAALAPGDYSLELTATAAAGQAKETLNFRVTS